MNMRKPQGEKLINTVQPKNGSSNRTDLEKLIYFFD